MAAVATAHTGGTWLVASLKEGRPITLDEAYPCRCEDLDDDPPQWKVERAKRTGDGTVFRCDPWQVKGTAEWRNRCDCWGQALEGKPEGCCAHHERNPRYLVIIEGVDITAGAEDIPKPVDSAPPPLLDDDDPAGADETSAPSETTPPPLDDDYPDWTEQPDGADRRSPPEVDDAPPDYLGQAFSLPPEDPAPARYARRWSADEITCPCRTPWDGLKKGFGFHCVACCRNFKNVGAAQMHGGWLKPCKDPASIVDMGPGPTTGTPLMRLSYSDSGHEVWS